MKKIYLYIALAVLAFSACETYYADPISDFSVSSGYVEPGEFVVFTNYSTDFEYVEWDFGDGTTTRVSNPTHKYNREGTYTVTLTAYNHGLVDYSYYTIEVLYTTLEVVVYDIDNKDLIVNIPVLLYGSYDDWYYDEDLLAEGRTDRNGSVVFEGVQDISYFIWSEDNTYTNWYLPDFDINYIKTLPLLWARHNVFDLAVEYLPVQKAYKAVMMTERDDSQRINREKRKSSKSYGSYKEWKEQLKK